MTPPARNERPAPAEGAGYPAGPPPGMEDIHRLLVDTVRDYAIFALDASGHILTWNAGARRLKGYAPEDVIGRHFSIFYPPEAVATGFPQYELDTAAVQGAFEDEGWRIRKDGTRFWANVIITALRGPGGELVGFAKVTRDLTDRKRAEETLRESEQRFRLLVHSVQDYGIFMLDPKGNIVSWNEGAERIKGYTAQEIVGRHFSVFYPPEELVARKPQRELRAAAKLGRFEDEGWRIRKDGTSFWANVIITALRDESGELIGFAKVTRDLTERRASELRAIADARRIAEAEAANRAKSDFLAAMSHELRTPLNAIGGYADLILLGIHGPVTEPQRDALNRIRSSQLHLLALISDLLNFSRIEAGRITYDIRPVPLCEVIADVRAIIEALADVKHITIDWPADDDETTAQADRPRVEQVLLNLVSNAVKYTEDGGHIIVRCFSEADSAVVEVEDDGIGIPEDKLDAIFEPFVQVGRSLVTPKEGAGLGLAISRDLARAMDGEITVQSIVDRGSTFRLVLPRA